MRLKHKGSSRKVDTADLPYIKTSQFVRDIQIKTNDSLMRACGKCSVVNTIKNNKQSVSKQLKPKRSKSSQRKRNLSTKRKSSDNLQHRRDTHTLNTMFCNSQQSVYANKEIRNIFEDVIIVIINFNFNEINCNEFKF